MWPLFSWTDPKKVRRQIKSAAGKHTFEVDISLSEETEGTNLTGSLTNNQSKTRMKAVEKFFLRLNNREQTLLVITLWTVLLIGLIQTLKFASILYQDWKFADQTMSGHQTIISLKPMIDSALEKQKTEQKNKSYDKNQLSNLASRLADQVFPQKGLSRTTF